MAFVVDCIIIIIIRRGGGETDAQTYLSPGIKYRSKCDIQRNKGNRVSGIKSNTARQLLVIHLSRHQKSIKFILFLGPWGVNRYTDFLWFSQIFVNFHWGAQNGWKSRKTKFYVFCLFTPLYRRFRLPRVPQREELFEIYRLVSKIVHFMPCGLVLAP